VPRASLAAFARYLGLWDAARRMLVAPHEAAASLALDLALYEPVGRAARGIDRVAASEPESGAAHVLAALREARLSLFRITGRHPAGGLWLAEISSEDPVRLMDDTLSVIGAPGAVYAMRIAQTDGEFAITTGAVFPVDTALLDAVRRQPPPPTQLQPSGEFAARLYRAALEQDVFARGVPAPRR
jgi:hypothetical protein